MKTLILLLISLQVSLFTPCRATQTDDPFALAVADRMEDKDLRIPIPEDGRQGRGVRIEVERVNGNEVTLRLLNDSKEAVFIPGHGLKSPFYEAETFADNRWSFDPNHMNCGTGAYLAPLASGEWFRFKVKLPDGTRLARIQFQFEGEADQAGNRKTTDICTDPIKISGEQGGGGQPATRPESK